MLTSIAAILAPADTAVELVSKMIKRYSDAQTLSGNIKTTVTIGNQRIIVTSNVQIERPLKMHLFQKVEGQTDSFLVVSDGKKFSYPKPMGGPSSDRDPNGRLVEPIFEGTKLGDVYRAIAGSVAERSAILDLLVSDTRDLMLLRDQWSTLSDGGKVDLSGTPCRIVKGDWRLNKISETSGEYSMWITEQGELKKYSVVQAQGAALLGKGDYDGDVKREHAVDIEIGKTIDQNLFSKVK